MRQFCDLTVHDKAAIVTEGSIVTSHAQAHTLYHTQPTCTSKGGWVVYAAICIHVRVIVRVRLWTSKAFSRQVLDESLRSPTSRCAQAALFLSSQYIHIDSTHLAGAP